MFIPVFSEDYASCKEQVDWEGGGKSGMWGHQWGGFQGGSMTADGHLGQGGDYGVN